MTTTTPVVTSLSAHALLEHEVTVITVVSCSVEVVNGVIDVLVSKVEDSDAVVGTDVFGVVARTDDDSEVVAKIDEPGTEVSGPVAGVDDFGIVVGTEVYGEVAETEDSGVVEAEVFGVVEGTDDDSEVVVVAGMFGVVGGFVGSFGIFGIQSVGIFGIQSVGMFGIGGLSHGSSG